MGSKNHYRIVLVTTPLDGYSKQTYMVEKYRTREAPNGDYWEYAGIKASTPHGAKQELIDKLSKKQVIEEFEL